MHRACRIQTHPIRTSQQTTFHRVKSISLRLSRLTVLSVQILLRWRPCDAVAFTQVVVLFKSDVGIIGAGARAITKASYFGTWLVGSFSRVSGLPNLALGSRRTNGICRSPSLYSAVLISINLVILLERHFERRKTQRRRRRLSMLLSQSCLRKVLFLRLESCIGVGLGVTLKATTRPIHDNGENMAIRLKEGKVDNKGGRYNCNAIREFFNLHEQSPELHVDCGTYLKLTGAFQYPSSVLSSVAIKDSSPSIQETHWSLPTFFSRAPHE